MEDYFAFLRFNNQKSDVTGILAMFSIGVPAFIGIIMGIVAIVAGLLMLFGKDRNLHHPLGP